MKHELSGPNSWEWVRKERTAQKNSADYPVRHALENAWRILDEFYNEGLDEPLFSRDEDELQADSPLASFLYCIDMGFYPPPEVLLSLAECFRLYFSFNGKVSLEDVFFGGNQKGVGNYSARKAREWKYVHFAFEATLQQLGAEYRSEPVPSLPEIAEKYLKDHGYNDDVDSFLRSYRRRTHLNKKKADK